MIGGSLKQAGYVDLEPGENPEMFEKRIRIEIAKEDTGDGALVLVDMLGGTPFNRVGILANELNIAVITGMNMPMLMSVLMERREDTTLQKMANMAKEAAIKGIRLLKK
jgi:mannose/fructose-specific phosphotransferase system component IIA